MRTHSLLAGLILAVAGAFGATPIQTALDNTSLSFTTGGDAAWFAQSDDVHTGSTALRSGAITDNQETWVETTVSGAGMLSFWWKASSESADYDWLEVSVDGNVQDQIGGSDAGWKQKSVFTIGAESHVIRWRYRKDGSVSDGEDCGWLDKVEWTPVPESMTVSFAVNCGNPLQPVTAHPGDLISSLPIPTIGDSRVFGGWFYDAELTSRALETDKIPYRNLTLYANWVWPIWMLTDKSIAFASETWKCVRGDDGGYWARAELPHYYSTDPRPDRELSMTVTGPGTLTFEMRTEGAISVSCSCEDDSRYWDEFGWEGDGAWQTEVLQVVSSGEQQITLSAWNYYMSEIQFLEARNFIWTPAPEKIVVYYETNGGEYLAPANMTPGDTFGRLAIPTRDGYEFAGWYLDEDFRDKAYEDDRLPFDPAVTVYARWVKPMSLMDGNGVSFSSSDYSWEPVEGGGRNGGIAAVCTSNYGGTLELGVEGYGTLTFKWRSNGGSFYWWLDDGDGEAQSLFSDGKPSVDGWCVETIQVASAGPHCISLCQWESPGASICDVTWTPAPETILVDFVTNGGDSLDPVGYAPGDAGDSLPVPVRDGYEFLGWYWDPEFRDFVDDGLLPFAEELTVYAKWGRPVSELDDDTFSFRTFSFGNAGTIPWHVERTAGITGGAAAVAEIPVYQQAGLVTMVEGKGTLSFKWRVDPVDNVSASGYFDLSVDDETKWSPGYWSYGAWQEESVMVLSDDAEEVRWVLYNDGWDASMIRYLVCDVAWTPAPEKMTVSFDADMDPNPSIAAQDYVPGDTFGELPTPTRSGWTFAGWHRDSPAGESVHEEDVVPFQESIRLVARWTRPVVYLHDAGFTYSATGEDQFYLTNVKTPGGTLAAGVTLTKESSPYWIGDDPARYTDKPATLNTAVTGPGYLSFEWAAQTPQDTSVNALLLLDGEEVADFSLYGYNAPAGSDREHVYIPAGKHTLSWVVHGSPSFESHGGACEESTGSELVASPSLFVGDIAFEKPGPQKDAQAWMEKLHDYGVFVTGDLARFKAAYAARITKDGTDYEARIFHALTMLAELAENADFKKFATTFGFTVDYTRCSFSGKPKLDSKTAGANDMVDKAISVVVPVLKNALKDLEAIPDDWSGEVVLSAREWPVDTDTSIDRGDVRYARASLEGVLATLYFMGGYDLTADWAKGKAAADWRQPLPVVSKIPAVDDDMAWEAVAPHRVENWGMPQEGPDALIRAAICGNSVAIRLESDLATGVTAESVRLSVGLCSGSTKINLDSFTCVSAEGRLLLKVDCSKISNFAKKTWSLGRGWVDVSNENVWYGWKWADARSDDAFVQKCLIEQTKFLSKVRNASRLSTAETWVRKALVSALAADEAVTGRADDGRLHFVEYDPEDAERLEVARRNTASALNALDGETAFNIKELYQVFGSESKQVDLSLLPDDGWINVYLGALFKGKITRAMKPATHLNRYGEMIVEVGTLKDPTFAGLFPGMTVGKWWNVSDAFGRAGETPAVEHALVPGEKVALNCPQYIGYSVSGLPKGWKWDSKKGMLTGTVTGGKFTLTFSAGGMKAKETFTVGAKPKVYASIAEGEDGVGVKAVPTAKAYLANESVKVTAALKSGYAFNGWYDAEGRMVSPKVSYTFKMPLTDVSLTAKAVSLREDGFELWSERWIGEPVELKVGEAVSTEYGAYFGYSTVSPCTVSASGLPSGVKLAKVNGEYVLKGAPTKKGVYYATFSGKNNGGFKMSAVVKFVVGGAKETFTNTAQIELERFAWGDPYTGYDYENYIPVPAAKGKVKKVKLSGLPNGLSYKYPVSTIVDYEKDASGETDWDKPIYGNCLKISGIPTKAGLFTLTATVTYSNGKTAKSQRKVVVFDSGSVYVPVSLEEGSEGRGTVSGGGVKSYGATVKLVAKTKDEKKYFFAGWQILSAGWIDNPWEDEPDEQIFPFGGQWSPATYSFKLTSDYYGEDIYGRFVTKAEDVIEFDSKSYDWRVEYAPTCAVCADSKMAWTTCPFECMSGTKPKITATGLPAGTKLSGSALVVSSASKLKPGHYTVKLTAKNVTGNSASATVNVVVPNLTTAVDKGYLGLDTSDEGYGESSGYGDLFRSGVKTSFTLEELGVWVAEGWTLSVSGLPKGWTYKNGKISGTATATGPKTVTFKVTKGRTSYTATATFNLSGLPDWAVGTFIGSTLTTHRDCCSISTEEGTMSFTVSATGAISGKYVMGADGSTTSFSGSGFTWRDDGRLSASVTGKVDGKKKAFTLVIGEGGAFFSGKISSSESIASELLVKNPWTGPNVDKETLPTFASGVQCSFPWTGYFKGSAQAGTVSLSFSGNGKVAAKFKTKKGTVSASLQLADFSIERSENVWSGYLVVGIPANKSKKFAGAYCYLQFSMIEDEDGLVHDVIIYDEYDPGWPMVIGFGYLNGYE